MVKNVIAAGVKSAATSIVFKGVRRSAAAAGTAQKCLAARAGTHFAFR
jgi:hypothetical protein